MSTIYKAIGMEVYKSTSLGYGITGNPSKEVTIKEFESAYDFEEHIEKHVACKTITFDSEFCQFYAYAKTKKGAIAFVKRIEKHFEKLQKQFG
jgi:hypothetical protein